MMNNSWTETQTNQEILEEREQQRSLIATNEKTNYKTFDCIRRHNSFIRNRLEEKIMRKKGRERPQGEIREDVMRYLR